MFSNLVVTMKFIILEVLLSFIVYLTIHDHWASQHKVSRVGAEDYSTFWGKAAMSVVHNTGDLAGSTW
jgi:hypothetical protein